MNQEIIIISPAVTIYPWVYRRKITSYTIQRNTILIEEKVTLTPAEFNAIACRAPIVQGMKSALRDALDWIEDEYLPDRYNADFYNKRSRVIEGARAAIQAVEDAGE